MLDCSTSVIIFSSQNLLLHQFYPIYPIILWPRNYLKTAKKSPFCACLKMFHTAVNKPKPSEKNQKGHYDGPFSAHALYFVTLCLSILLKCKTGTLYPCRRIIGESDKIRPLWTSAPLTNQCEGTHSIFQPHILQVLVQETN